MPSRIHDSIQDGVQDILDDMVDTNFLTWNQRKRLKVNVGTSQFPPVYYSKHYILIIDI